MKLSYFDLISPAPVYIKNLGGILSPTLKQISQIGHSTYHQYLSILLSLSEQPEMLISDSSPGNLLKNILDFFFEEHIVFYEKEKCFLAAKDGNDLENTLVGVITKENYSEVCDIICQRNYIKSVRQESPSAAKSRKAQEIMEKLQKGRAEKQKYSKSDENMELGNIISAVANKHPSLNIINIWDLTIYQLWDCFSRISINNLYDIQSMSAAAWGNKDNHFDAAAWYKRI